MFVPLFKIYKLCILLTEYINMFGLLPRINSDYFYAYITI